MDETFPHLPLQREEPVNDKRPASPPRFKPPEDTAAHGKSLRQHLVTATTEAATDEGGFDERRLFRFTVEKGFSPDELPKIASPEFRDEIEVVSQEGKEVVVAFISDAALESFEALLTTLAGGEIPSNKQVFYALQGIDGWQSDDRMGWALRREGFPEEETFLLDIELWPLEDSPRKRDALWAAFEKWIAEHGIFSVDSVKQPGITLYRVRCNTEQAESLLHYRDVRTVDLLPRYGIALRLRYPDIGDFGDIPIPPEDAPGITVLDSGLTTGHPMIGPAVGEAESFLPGKDPADEHGHGTLVGGLALYGDIESRIREGRFVPELHLFSGRILDENAENGTGFVENHISEAVHYFKTEYGCKVFNLSFGDLNKPYMGGHIRDLAFTLDTLSRELDILFVVSTGNVLGRTLDGLEWRERYPQYLLEEDWSILDPAPALNVLTVGSLARYDRTTNSQRYPNDPAEVTIAEVNQPSPFTRHGPTVGGAIKPDLVAYGGNWAINTRGGINVLVPNSGLGELSTNWQSVSDGRLFADGCGTSFAAPQVAYLAAMLQHEISDISPNLMRALLVAHAQVPEEVTQLFSQENDAIRRVCGYGMVNTGALSRSLENEVTLISESLIPNKKHHFYEIPIPEDFVSKGRRIRELSVALAYTPYVRSTRIDYRASRISFKLVAADNLADVSTMFNQATDKETYDAIKEIGKEIGGNRNVTSVLRNKGTVQSATWFFKLFSSKAKLKNQRLFVVVTRHDFPWGDLHSKTEEDYALIVAFRDRENDKARLYTQIRNRTQARLRAQV